MVTVRLCRETWNYCEENQCTNRARVECGTEDYAILTLCKKHTTELLNKLVGVTTRKAWHAEDRPYVKEQ